MDPIVVPVKVAIGAAMITITILCIVLWMSRDTTDYAKFIDGSFIGDPEYCKSAEISSMIVVLGPPTKGTIEGHLLINNDVCNQTISIKVKKTSVKTRGIYEVTGDVVFGEDPIFDSDNVKFRFNLCTGQLRIYKGGELYGLLYRDNITSAQEYE